MAASNAKRAAPGVSGNGPLGTGELIGSLDSETKVQTPAISHWRQQYRVHPVADVFPMRSNEDLDKLGEEINANGLNVPLSFCWVESGTSAARRVLIDGRNRLEAMERVGIRLGVRNSGLPESLHGKETANTIDGDPVTLIIGLNIHRRHLTKQQQADLIVAAVKAAEKPGQAGPVSGLTDFGDQVFDGINELVDQLADGSTHIKGGRGKRNPIKEKALAINAALPKEQQVSERTIKRAMAKAEGKTPAAKQYTARPMPKPRSGKPVVGIDAVRQCYLDRCAEPDVDLDSEQEIVIDALREIAGKRAMRAQADDDLGDIPEGLDRRRQGGAP